MSHAAVKERVSSLKGTFVPLLVALMVVLVIAPVAEDWPVVASVLVTVLLVTGVLAVHEHSLLRRGMVVAVVITLVLRWLAHVHGEEHRSLVIVSHLALGIYMLLLTGISVAAVLRRERVTGDTILGAVCGYILIAYVFTFGYAVIEDLNPGNFSSSLVLPEYDGAKIGHGTPELLYYSFVTLTTVGYGDIVPATPVARIITICEVFIGYIMLGGLLSIFTNKMAKRGD